MFNALLTVQWKWTRIWVLFATIIGFAIPMTSARPLMFRESVYRITAGDIVSTMQSAGVVYAVLAGGIGLAVAFLAWNADQKGRHIYALSLPVSRSRYALMRFGAGSVFLLIPAAGVLLGCLVAIALAQIPAGMHAYPVTLTLRFLLASFVAFSIFFGVAAASQKAAATLLVGIGGFIVLAVIIGAMGVRTDIIGKTLTLIFAEPGVLSIFTGRWMLIDV
ncbi:MAG: hypothetical protein ABIR92_02635 [Gemmatimonadaceae bacterium]